MGPIVGMVLLQCAAVGQALMVQPDCTVLNESVLTDTVANRLNQVEAAIAGVIAQNRYVCAGVMSGTVAVLLAVHGRMGASEAFAVRSIDLLKKNIEPDDPMLLAPLYALAIAGLEQGKFRKAEEAYEQMLQVRTASPGDKGQVHVVGGALRQMQGRLKEAESEYLMAFENFSRSEKRIDGDMAALLGYLGNVYLAEARLEEASQVLDRAFALLASFPAALPQDQVKILYLRAAVYARQRRWVKAEEKLRQAVTLADAAGVSEPVFFIRLLLTSYAVALRKNHHRKDARVVAERIVALPRDQVGASLIDVVQLSANSKD